MSIFTKIFTGSADKIINSVGNVLDEVITTQEEKDAAKLAIQKVLTKRNLPSDIIRYAEQQRVSESTGKTQVIGDCDIIHVLRILLKGN